MAAGWTQMDLAYYLHMDAATVSLRMTGRTTWTMDEAYATLAWLGLPETAIGEYFPRRTR